MLQIFTLSSQGRKYGLGTIILFVLEYNILFATLHVLYLFIIFAASLTKKNCVLEISLRVNRKNCSARSKKFSCSRGSSDRM